VWTDLNGRGTPDLLVTNDGESNFLYRNDGHGHFTDQAQIAGIAVNQDGVEQANMGVAIGDYLHTGRLSVAISHFSDEYMTLFRNDGDLNFTDVSVAAGIAAPTRPYVGWGDAFVDLDNDGWRDLFLVNGHVYPQVDNADTGTRYREPALLFQNERDGRFRDLSKAVGPAVQVPRVSRGLAVGDLFDDGKQELVIEDLEGSPTILRPEGGAQHHWIELSLVGTRSNRLALNARAKVTAGDLVQVDEVRSGGSYLSQNDLRLHFGLGDHERVDTVEVAWPSGAKQTFTGLAADHIYSLTEGQAAAVPFVPLAHTQFHDHTAPTSTRDAASQLGDHP
jgi:hypothetical protein